MTEEVQKNLEKLLSERDLHSVRSLMTSIPPVEAAEHLALLDEKHRVLVFRILPREVAGEVFSEFDVDVQKSLLNALGDKHVASLLEEMAADDRTALFEEFPADAARQLVMLLPREERIVALSLLGYPEGSVGRLMSPRYLAIKQDWNIREVLDFIRTNGTESDSLNMLYVVDDKGTLLDELTISQILLASPETQVGSLMNFSFQALKGSDDQEQAVKLFKRYNRPTFPVIDSNGALLGIVTVDDILFVQEEESTEDIQKLGAVEALEDPYIKTSVTTLIRKRASWLVVLFIGELGTASAMAFFEGELSKAVVLALFIPLIISSGGNSGSQASTLIIRALAVGEISLRDWPRVLTRELRCGFALGCILASLGFFRVVLWQMFTGIYGPHWLSLGMTVSLALVGVVLFGSVVGAMLPFGLKALKIDPATSSAPFVATLVDVTGLIIYFSVAALLFLSTL